MMAILTGMRWYVMWFWLAFPWLAMLNIFSCACWPSLCLWEDVLVLCSFLILFILGIKLYEFFVYFGYYPLIRHIDCKYLLPFSKWPLFCCKSNTMQKAFYLDVIPFVYFLFCCPWLWSQIQQSIPKTNAKEHTVPMLSSSFMDSGPTFKSLIHVEFIFVYGIK